MNHSKYYQLPVTFLLINTRVIRINIFILLILFSISAHAQAPEGFNYSAIVRDNTGDPLTDQSVSFRFSIIRGNVAGTVVYSETHNTTTNQLGQVSLIIGNGSVLSGVFANIAWGADAYFLKVELDRDGGNSYVEMGISQFLSVPYALYAKTAGSGGGGETGDLSIAAGDNLTISGSGTTEDPYIIGVNRHYIGEEYGGGKVFFVYDNEQHGLIAAKTDQDLEVSWDNGIQRYTNTTGDGLEAGAMNTALIIALQTEDDPLRNFAAKICADYSVTVEGIKYDDWYLPSKYELGLLFFQKDNIGEFSENYYWSSTEFSSLSAWCQNFRHGVQTNQNKGLSFAVRAIRAF